eukprot:1615347-Prymnesium_polylepis.1
MRARHGMMMWVCGDRGAVWRGRRVTYVRDSDSTSDDHLRAPARTTRVPYRVAVGVWLGPALARGVL